jgi:hypothetical protein
VCETYSMVSVGKHLSNEFTIQNGFKHGGVLLFNFVYSVPLGESKVTSKD